MTKIQTQHEPETKILDAALRVIRAKGLFGDDHR
jgi:hypothetical protein